MKIQAACAATLLLSGGGLAAQESAISPTKIRLGQAVAFESGAKLAITMAGDRSSEVFKRELGQEGEGTVIDLTFEAKDGGSGGLNLEPSTDATKSAVAMTMGDQRVAPSAIATYYPEKPDKRPQVFRVASMSPMPKTGRGYLSWVYEGKGIVSLLFEPTANPAGAKRTLSVTVGVGKEDRLFLVDLDR